MKLTSTAMTAVAGMATVVGAGIGTAPTASADNYPVTQKFGTQEELVDAGATSSKAGP